MDNKKKSDGGNFLKGLTKICGWIADIAWMGIRTVKWREAPFLMSALSVLILTFAVSFGDYAYLKVLNFAFPSIFSPAVIHLLRKIRPLWHFSFLFLSTTIASFVVLGFGTWRKRRKFQQDLDTIGLGNAKGDSPQVVHVVEINDSKTRLLIKSKGIGVDKFEAKRGDLEFSFGQIIEGIAASADRQTINVLLCKKELTKMIPFSEVVEAVDKPYTFLVGESASGLIKQDLRELPHLLIAGSTGGGKSVFFRQMLIGLLRSSSRLQLYLIDLKRGVEVKEFSELPNVRVAKNEEEAVQLLRVLKNEMHRRFVYMESKNIKKIDPALHQMDLIVLAIDEASVLYGKVSSNKVRAQLVTEARELTDDLAKLSRAAGIHLVIATQKAVKESLDTKTLENLVGRISFKMSTHAGSTTALGNSDAYALPDIKGRAIWSGGDKFIEVQTPYLDEKELESECVALVEKMNGENGKPYGPMLDLKIEAKTTGNEINQMVTSKSAA